MPRLTLPLFEFVENSLHPRTLATLARPGTHVKVGGTLELQLRRPEHFLLLAISLTSKSNHARFELFFDGQARVGYLAGVVQPRLPSYPSVREAITRLYFHHHHFKKPMELKLLLIDTFTVEGEPHRNTGSVEFAHLLHIDVDAPDSGLLIGDIITDTDRRRAEERFRSVADAVVA